MTCGHISIYFSREDFSSGGGCKKNSFKHVSFWYFQTISFYCLDGTSTFEIDLKVSEAEDGSEIRGIITIGQRIKFDLNLMNPTEEIKTSPQNCYATRYDGTDRYDIISKR